MNQDRRSPGYTTDGRRFRLCDKKVVTTALIVDCVRDLFMRGQRHAPANRFLVVAFHKTYGGCLER